MELDWEKNLGVTDRMMRIIIGITLLVLATTKTVTGWWANGAVILAIIQFVEGFFGY